MKNIFNKFAFFIALSFVFISCGNLTTSENDDSIPQGKGKITISTDLQNGRSVLPTAIEETTTGLKWELVGTKDGTQQISKFWTDDNSRTAYQSMTSDSGIVIDTGTWDFTLTASNTDGENVLSATISTTINAGENKLNFVMQEATENAASGSIEFTLNFPKDVVGNVVAKLFKYENNDTEISKQTLSIDSSSTDNYSSVKYSYPDATTEELKSGYYILKIELQQEKGDATTPTVEPKTINTYSCLIRVAPGLLSQGKYTLTDLAQLYTIKYECGRGNIENQLTTTSYNAYTSFELPEPTYQGYYFAGWYTQEYADDGTLTEEKFLGNAGDTITINKDTTLYAKWVKAYEFNLYDPTGKPVSDGYKVEKGIGSVTLDNTGDSVWDYYLKSTDIKFTEKNNYKITVEMKAEADSVVAIQAANADMFFTVGKEWTPCTMETGFIEKQLDSTRNAITFGIGLSQKTYFRNLVIEEISDDGLPTLVFDITTEGINQYLNTQNKADKIIEVKKTTDTDNKLAYNITINAPLTNGNSVQNVKLHLRDYAKAIGANNVSFEVKNTGEYPFATSFMADTASNNSMAWNNVRTEVVYSKYNSCNIDFPNYTANDELTVDVITGSDNVYSNYPVEFTISNFKVEEPVATSTPFANKIFAIKTGNTWTQEKSVEVTIPAGSNKEFDVGMFNGWDSSKNMPSSFDDVTRFLYTESKPIPENLAYSYNDNPNDPIFTITNESVKDKIVKISLNEKYEVVIEDVSSIVTTWAELKYRIDNTSISEIEITKDLVATSDIRIGRAIKISAQNNKTISRNQNYTGTFFIVPTASLELSNITLDGGNKNYIDATGPLIWAESGSTSLTLTNCILQNNKIVNRENNPMYEQGGAVKTEQPFTMNGGSIIDCHGSNGGAVYTFANGSFTMNGGSISGCTATENGNAVYIGSGNLTLSGDAEITSDVYIANGSPVIVAGDLTKDKVATIKLPSYNVDSPVLTAENNELLAQSVGKFALSDETYSIGNDGKIASTVSYAEGLTYDSTSDTLYISTAAGLATFRDIVNDDLSEKKLVKGHNNSEPKTFYGENDDEFTIEKNLAINGVLENDIDLVNNSWTPIGKNSSVYCYEGVFDGQNHTISNINITSTSTNPVGFFGSVYKGTVKNLVVEGTIDSNYYTGGITGYLNKGTIENCVNKTTITNESMNGTGGIVGYVANNTSSIKNCINIGNVSSSLSTVGGIVGNVANITAGVSSLTINKCINLGEISGTSNVSGILGNAPTTAITISDCLNIGKISATGSDYAYASGITTPSASYSVTTSINVGEIYGISTGAIASVTSYASSYTKNYYDSTVNSSVVDVSTSGITGKITAQLLALTSNELSDQWSFSVERYPLPNIGSSIPGGENGEIWQTVVTAATPDEIPSGGNEPLVGTEVASFEALQEAINGDAEVIIITKNITITECLNISRVVTIAANTDVVVTDNVVDDNMFFLNPDGNLTFGGGSGVLTFIQGSNTYTAIATSTRGDINLSINIKDNVKFTNRNCYWISFNAGANTVLNITGGEFTDNTRVPIYINNAAATCNMTGGLISNNTDTTTCAGISVNKGNLTITGGDITNNTVTGNSSLSGSSIRVPSTSNGSVTVNSVTLTASTTYTTNIIDGKPQE